MNGFEKDKNDNSIQPTKSSDSTLKYLEDPTFSFDEPKSSSLSSKSLPVDETAKMPEPVKETPTATASLQQQPQQQQQPKRPSYRVLEDPDLDTPMIPPRTGKN